MVRIKKPSSSVLIAADQICQRVQNYILAALVLTSQVDPRHKRARSWRTWRSRRHVLLVAASVLSLVVLITNFVLAIVASAKHGYNITPMVVLFEGKCARINTMDIYFQVGIFILSNLLLGASALCMQVLAAPTRQEVEAAHRRGKWLDIGVSSWRNLRRISGHKQILWWCLGTTSIPLHLM